MSYENLLEFKVNGDSFRKKLQRSNKNHNLISKSDLNPYDKFE